MRFHAAAVLLASLVWCSTSGAQSNLIQNPCFELARAGATTPGGGWWLYTGRGQPQISVDREQPHGGAAAVRLQAGGDARFALVSAPFAVSPGDEIRFEAWVRCEKKPGGGSLGNFALAFRDAAGRVFNRAQVSTENCGSEWTLIAGKATVPENGVRAELHLGYNNAAGTLWFDDVRAGIINPLSLSLVTGAQPWAGPQTITARVINRRPVAFRGVIRAVVARKTSDVPLDVEPGADTRVEIPVALAGVGAHDYTLSLLDGGGTSVRSLRGKFRTVAPLVLFPGCPCYHVAGDGDGSTRIDAQIALHPERRSGVRFTAALIDASGRELESAAADASTGDIVGVTLHVPVESPARFSVKARLFDAAGGELAAANTDVHVRPRTESVVTLGEDGFLRIGGKPHFPIGMYSSGRPEEMSRAGFSATHSYGITAGDADKPINPNDPNLKELLDRAASNGMRMMVELPRAAVTKRQWAQIRRRIETFRHHPGLLCWGSEERVARGEAPLSTIQALYRLVHELDPDHPLVLGDTRDAIGKLQKDRRNFFPDDAMDVGIWWWYPIPLNAPDGNGLEGNESASGLLEPPTWLTTSLSHKPLWIAIQSYQKPRQDARFPTPAEYRCMAYLSIINGAKGLWFYTGSGQRDWQGKPAGLLNKPEEGHWPYVQQLARELRELEPAITAKPVPDVFEMSPKDEPVEFSARNVDGALYLMVANKSDRARNVRFTGRPLAGKTIKTVGENHPFKAEGETLAVGLGALAVHVYKIE